MISPVCFLLVKVLQGEEEGVLLCSFHCSVFDGNQAGMDAGTAALN